MPLTLARDMKSDLSFYIFVETRDNFDKTGIYGHMFRESQSVQTETGKDFINEDKTSTLKKSIAYLE